ncbi:MAG TPA: MFS transporter [Armatimonadota bacterium]|nr:MFS transporter [Armatimonadota bacterium]
MSTPARRLGISRTVVVLGVVSLLTDISSEGIYPLIPLFLVNVLHARVTAVGLIEGVAESTASVLRIFSGWLSDVLGRRKWITAVGYGLSTISKPLFALTTTWPQVFAVRFADRVGKGVRTAPRDALIADVTPPESRGISFGFHRAMDTAGAIAGPLLAFWLLRSFGLGYRTIFFLSGIPAVLGVLILIAAVREPAHDMGARTAVPSVRPRDFRRSFKLFLLVATVFSIGNCSDAFLILRARDIGIGAARILLIYVLFNGVEAALSTSAGAVSDRLGRRNVILAGYLVFAAVYAGFGLARRPADIWALFVFYGLYQALTRGVQTAFAADLVSVEGRGTGLGAYHMLTGVALLPASLIAGYLWDAVNPSAPFYFGAATALVAALLLAVLFRGSVTYSDM